jgi:hypothetical protein
VTRALIALALVSGCTVGGSSSVVGRWRARRIVDSTACVENNAPGGGCDKVIAIGRDIPARRFTSLTFTFPATGYMQQRGGGKVEHGLVLASYFEYLRGRGGFALGARLGAHVGNGFGDKLYFMMPISVLAHAGGMWGSVYAGVGYSPVAAEQQYVGSGDDRMVLPGVFHHDSVHAFAGTRFWLRRTLERGLSANPELRIERFGGATLTSLTGNIGLHF